jgi:hypothetical protein
VELDDTVNDMTYIKVDNYLGDIQKNRKAPPPVNTLNQSLEIFDTPEEYKIHLELLSKDLAKNKKIQNL